jgi:hypothetical protein
MRFCERVRVATDRSEIEVSVVMLDRDKGLKEAVATVFPSANHRFCLRHLLAKMKNKFWGNSSIERSLFFLASQQTDEASTMLTSEGVVEKLNTRIALRGDMLKETMFKPDTWFPIAGFRALKMFLALPPNADNESTSLTTLQPSFKQILSGKSVQDSPKNERSYFVISRPASLARYTFSPQVAVRGSRRQPCLGRDTVSTAYKSRNWLRRTTKRRSMSRGPKVTLLLYSMQSMTNYTCYGSVSQEMVWRGHQISPRCTSDGSSQLVSAIQDYTMHRLRNNPQPIPLRYTYCTEILEWSFRFRSNTHVEGEIHNTSTNNYIIHQRGLKPNLLKGNGTSTRAWIRIRCSSRIHDIPDEHLHKPQLQHQETSPFLAIHGQESLQSTLASTTPSAMPQTQRWN